MKKSNKLTLYIVIAMIAGVILGYFVHQNSEPAFQLNFREIKL